MSAKHPGSEHIKILYLMSALRSLAPMRKLSADEAWLLDALVLRWHEHEELTVSDVMSSGEFGSQTTSYRRLISLRDKGFINLTVCSEDRRVKIVEPSEHARMYIRELENGITSLAQGSNKLA